MIRLKPRTFFQYLFVCTLLLTAVSCRNYSSSGINIRQTRTDSLIRFTLNQKPTQFRLVLVNPDSAKAEFYFSPEGVNLLSNETILSSIIHKEMTDRQKAIALWQFLCVYRFHCDNLSQSSQKLHNPAELVNTFGCGLCDDVNSSLAHLAQLAGLQARVVGLSGHVIAEIFFENGWHFFDADGRSYFERADGHIYSLHEIAQRKELIEQSKLNYIKKRFLIATVCSEENNVVSTYYKLIDSSYHSGMVLPPKAQFLFQAVPPALWDALIAYVNQDTIPIYTRIGKYTQSIQLHSADTIIQQHLNYAITKVHVRSYYQPCSYKVYYSADCKSWEYKGQTSTSLSDIVIIPYDTLGENFNFSYSLKFEPVSPCAKPAEVTIENEILFSDRALFNNPDKSFRIEALNGSNLSKLSIAIHAK